MKSYYVTIPITGTIVVEVEAVDEESAIEEAFNSDDLTLDNIEEWEPHYQICQGNVLHAAQNEVSVEEQ